MVFSNTVPGKGHSISGKQFRMTFVDREFPIIIAGKQNILRLSTRNRLLIAIVRRIVGIIHAPELSFFRPSSPTLSHSALARASDSRSMGICGFHLHRSIIKQQFHIRIALKIAASFGRICSHSPEKEAFDAGYNASPLSSDQGTINCRIFFLSDSDHYHPQSPLYRSAFSGVLADAFMLNSKGDSPDYLEERPTRQYAGIRGEVSSIRLVGMPYSVVSALSTEGKRSSFGRTMLSVWNNNKISTVKLSSKSRDGVLARQSFSSIASSKILVRTEPSFILVNQVFGARGSSFDAHQSQDRHAHLTAPRAGFANQYNILSKNKLVFFSGTSFDFMPTISVVRDHEGASIGGYSPKEGIIGSGIQWISRRSSFDNSGGRSPDLILPIKGNNLKASLQKDASSSSGIEKKAYHSDGSRTSDRTHGSDQITAQKTEIVRHAFDLVKIADHVYTILENKIKMERERRGYYGL